MKQIRVAVCVLGLMGLLAANVAMAQGPPMPKPGPEQQRLHYFVGQWKHEGEMKPGPYGPGGKFTSTEECRMIGDFFLTSHSKSTGPMGPMEDLYTIGYDPKLKTYTYDDFSSMGMHEKSTGNVSGKVWTWTNDTDMGGKTMKGKFVLTEVSPTSYTYTFDMSNDDGKTWSNMMSATATKVK